MRKTMFETHGHEFDDEIYGEGFGPQGPRGFGRRGFGRGAGPRGFGPPGPWFGPRGFGPGGPGFGPGGPGGPGGRGFGPGGPGFGPGGPGFGRGWGFGPGGPGFRGHGGWHGRGRRGRGNVRAAILALLAEEPRHGYAIMTELAERSGGLWRPSPGSVYPVLQQLQDEGLVTSTDSDGRKVFDLTPEGRRYVEEHVEELHEPWQVADHGPRARFQSLMQSGVALAAAVQQVAQMGDDQQVAEARAILDQARQAMYRILAGDTPGTEPGAEPGPESQV
jgi:DNA-binding PadR family transcriptional regulator